MGGDGTIHEVLNGMMNHPNNQSILGLIPAGTANDYAAAFSKRPKSDRNDPLRVDVGRLTWSKGSRYFANVAGLGLSGEIANCARSMTRIPARVRYTSALLRRLGPGYGARAMRMSLDDEPMVERETLLISVALGPREGSYPLHAKADLTDGLFEILRIGRLARRELAWHFPAMLRGSLPQDHPQVMQQRCRRIHLASQDPIPIHLDGEFPKAAAQDDLREITLEVVPQAVEVEVI
jgi:diacylglycerol kinase (ATP)